MRNDGRKNNELRPIKFTHNFTKHALGSVLVEFGETKVIVTALCSGPLCISDGLEWTAKSRDGQESKLFTLGYLNLSLLTFGPEAALESEGGDSRSARSVPSLGCALHLEGLSAFDLF